MSEEKNYWRGAEDCIRALKWIINNQENSLNLFGTDNVSEIICDEDATTIVTCVQNEINELSILNDIRVGDLVNIGREVDIILIKIDRRGRKVYGFDCYGNSYTAPIDKVRYTSVTYDNIRHFLGGDE